MNITVGSLGINDAATTQPSIGRSSLIIHGKKNQMRKKRNSTDDLSHLQLGNGKFSDSTLQDSFQLKKAEVSITDGGRTEASGRNFSQSALGFTEVPKKKSTFSQHKIQADSSQILVKTNVLQLPALRGNSQALLRDIQPSDSLTKEKMANLGGNMQSQAGLRTLGLDMSDRKKKIHIGSSSVFNRRRGTEADILNTNLGQVGAAILPLSNMILTESMASSAHKKRRE